MKHLPLLLISATTLSGCFWATTKSEGKALRSDVDDLDVRLTRKEEDITGKVEELKRVLDEATKILKRNSADLGADVEALRNDIRVSTGLVSAAKNMLDELKAEQEKTKAATDERLLALETRLAAIEAGKTAAPTGNPDELWAQATAAFGAKRWNDARDAFKKLSLNFPTHDRADDAQYFRGETFFQEAGYDSAIGEYQKVWEKFADSALADDALFRAGEAAEKLKNCTEARAYFGALKQKYPKSTLLKKAGEKEKALKAAARNKSKCAS